MTFLIKFSDAITFKIALNIAKLYKIKYISKLKKKPLINLLNNFNAAKIIQRSFRKKLILNIECPICNEKLIYPFVSFKIREKFFYYDFNTIITYFEKTGDFRDPCTRTQISEKKIHEINSLISYYYGKSTKKTVITRDMIKTAEFNIVTYCLYDLIKELDYEKNNENEKETEKICNFSDLIYVNVLPRFIYYISYLISRYPKEEFIIVLNACKESIKNDTLLEYIRLIENNYC
jgi:hypothetical protein